MSINIEKTIKRTRDIINRDEDFKDFEEKNMYDEFKVYYILEDTKNKAETIVVVAYEDELLEVCPYKNKDNLFLYDQNYYEIDSYILKELENGKEIAYMSMETHFEMWNRIYEWYPNDIEAKKGLQQYFEYCKKNGLTNEKIKSKLDRKDAEVPDITIFYKYEIEEKQKKKTRGKEER